MSMREQTNITIDRELKKKAQEQHLELSRLMDKAIREQTQIKTVEMQESKECEFCGREMKKATRDDLNGLMWLYPDEKWICPDCIRKLPRSV